ncbi:MAG: ATP-binding protein [Gemmatimonadota bacterium]
MSIAVHDDVRIALLEQIFRQSPSFLLVVRTPECSVEMANAAYRMLVGEEELIGRPIGEVFQDATAEMFRQRIATVVDTGEPQSDRELPFSLLAKADDVPSVRLLDLNYIPLSDDDGVTRRVLCHGNDVTDRVQAQRRADDEHGHQLADLAGHQEELERTNTDLHEVAIELAVRTLDAEAARRDIERLLSESEAARNEAEAARRDAESANRGKAEFLAAMSHELRTPLNAIGGYAELMEIGVRGPVSPAQEEDLRRIRVSQRHLLRLVNEILNYARIETGTVHYDVEDVPLATLVASVEPLIAPQLAAKALRFHHDHCGDTPLIARADHEKTRQVLLNLLSNAIKFTEPGGTVDVACDACADWVLVKVRDSGIGIAGTEQERVFEPFVQVNASLTRTHEGAGLGLAISRDLARGMGGDLTLESLPGEGSTFTLALPRGADRMPAIR